MHSLFRELGIHCAMAILHEKQIFIAVDVSRELHEYYVGYGEVQSSPQEVSMPQQQLLQVHQVDDSEKNALNSHCTQAGCITIA